MKDVAAPHEQTLDVFNSKFYLFLPSPSHLHRVIKEATIY